MKLRIAAAAAALASAAAVGLASPASAATPTPNVKPAGAVPNTSSGCAFPYLCLWYNSYEQGSYALFYNDVTDFAGYTFTGPGAGQGQPVKNNAASATNWQTAITARIFYNSNYGGSFDDVSQSSSRELANTYNNNASFEWVN